MVVSILKVIFFFNDTATTEIYTLSLHDALPISWSGRRCCRGRRGAAAPPASQPVGGSASDRKSTRLNSSHDQISYAVFCLKKKNIGDIVGLLSALGADQAVERMQ